ncbi:MAG: polysaccharide lyase beta-sandwich domain-containing protein [Prevotellaceae bacterium]|jgi:chondroitin AC lyase|nr:polysaccharide lyase beta-sandwich domain-containing protein [Prevotellaceae bacterium]
MKRPLIIILLTFACRSFPAQAADHFDLIMGRIQARALEARPQPITPAEVNADGSLPGIDYANRSQVTWAPLAHLNKLHQLALAYVKDGHASCGKPDVYAAIEKMLSFWYDKDPRSTNWYMQQIACPQRMGVILILLRRGANQLPAELEEKLIARMEAIGGAPDQRGSLGSGANKIDIATHWVYRGCLTKNEAVLAKGAAQAFLPIELTTGEGLQHDYSWKQHGPQLYIGGYGDVVVQAVAALALYLKGTPYAMPDDKMELMSRFVLNTYMAVIRGSYMLYNVQGRSLTRRGALNHSGFDATLSLLAELDPANTEAYNAARKQLLGDHRRTLHTHFWRSDYTLHQSPRYTFDVRMATTTTYRNENGNGENLKGYFLADGANAITRTGDEYASVIPVWDWARLPGVTAPALTTIPQPSAWGTYGLSTFAGGVSDSTCGVTAYAYSDTKFGVDTKAKKSWFFFDNEVVCLGADITSTNAATLATTINQCRLLGSVDLVKANGDAELNLPEGDHTYRGNLRWVLHDKVAYYIPDPTASLVLTNKIQHGSWHDINTTQEDNAISQRVFSLHFDHGKQPAKARYAYVVVPGIPSADSAMRYPIGSISILSNTDTVQAVMHTPQGSQGLLGIVFYEAATFAHGDISVTADMPCIVMLRDTGSSIRVSLADPSKGDAAPAIKLDVAMPGLSLRSLSFALPTDIAHRGQTLEQLLKKGV